MQTALSYQRWSSAPQGGDDRDSKKRQADLAERYCREKGLKLIDTRIDEGRSAFRGANANSVRGKLRQLRNELENGNLKVDFVLIEGFDRLSRSAALDAIELLSSIVRSGPTVVTLNNNQEYSRQSLRENPMQIMVAIVEMMRSHDESLQKSRRAKSVWKAKQANAHLRPMTAKGPAWLRLDKTSNKWIIDEEKSKIVVGLYKMAAQGKSLDQSAKDLNDLGTKTLTGSPFWTRQQVLRILQSKAVVGIHEPKTAEYSHDENDVVKVSRVKLAEIPNYYPPIVENSLAEKVWRLNKTRSSFKGTGRAAFITSGIAKCHLCGSTMSYNVKQEKYRYIVCSNRRFNGCSNKRLVVYRDIENLLFNNLPEVLNTHAVLAEDETVSNLRNELVEVEAEIGRVGDAVRMRGFDASLGSLLDNLEAQRKALTHQLTDTSLRASKTFLERAIADLVRSIRNGDEIPVINQGMRLVFKSLVIDHPNKVIRLTLVDGSETFIALV
jgi:DNA invertase Pin-like site-specific DNA recombinase